jgi:hypothetical protein
LQTICLAGFEPRSSWFFPSSSDYRSELLVPSESRVLQQYLHPHVHSSTIHNSQQVEAMQCPSTNKWLHKM